jgi:hypothetical protein
MTSDYIILFAEKTKCPECHGIVYLMQDKRLRKRYPMFYICWLCDRIFEVGKGQVRLLPQ